MQTPLLFLLASLVAFVMIIGRYFLIAGIFHCWFYIWQEDKWKGRRLFNKGHDRKQYREEVKWSLITAVIFSLIAAATYLLWRTGATKVYTDPYAYPLWWLPLSLVLVMFIHETYYYWVHRWMHIPAVFRVVHKVHHNSHITSPWTAFSFHPLEGLLQAIILPLIILVIPVNFYVLLLLLTVMTFSSVVNHLGIEVYPAWMHRFWLGRLLIGATHHSMHHKQYRYNFGLYFTFWDRWGKTESPAYKAKFNEVTREGH